MDFLESSRAVKACLANPAAIARPGIRAAIVALLKTRDSDLAHQIDVLQRESTFFRHLIAEVSAVPSELLVQRSWRFLDYVRMDVLNRRLGAVS